MTARGTLVMLIALLVPMLAPGAGQATSGRDGVTAIAVQAPGPARYTVGDDGRVHVEYDLVIINDFPVEATLTSLVVRSQGRTLLRLTGDALAAHTHQTIGAVPTQTIPASSAVATLVDVVLPRSYGRRAPRRVSNHVGYTVAPSPLSAAIGSYTAHGPPLRVDRRPPTVVAPPLRGLGWVAGDACCEPTSAHRGALLVANGTFKTIETFAVDWVRRVDGVWHDGDGTALGDHKAFGAPVHAVADGTVISAINNRPNAPTNQSSTGNPTVRKPSHYAGNNAVIKIGRRKYAVYAHMQPGSVRVRRGQRVRTGQPIGRIGSSGNSAAPHLHFSVQDGPSPLTSNSLPFVIDRYRVQGRGSIDDPTPGAVALTGAPRRERRSYPLMQTVADFTR